MPSPDLKPKLDAILEKYTSPGGAHGVPGAIYTVADRNGVIYSNAAGERALGSGEALKPDTEIWFLSLTKLITAIAVYQLVEQGKVDLDTPLEELIKGTTVPEELRSGGKAKNKMTLRHAVLHTNGTSYDFFDQARKDDFDAGRVPANLSGKADNVKAKLNFEPGTHWQYGLGLDYAGLAVESLTGLSLDDYFKQHIFGPCNAKTPTFHVVLNSVRSSIHARKDGAYSVMDHKTPWYTLGGGVEACAGGAGLHGALPDYLEVLRALLNEGTHPDTGKCILQPQTVRELVKPQLSEEVAKDLDTAFENPIPELTNTFVNLAGVKKQWSAAGCLTPDGLPTGRSGDSFWWAGLSNNFYHVDFGRGIVAAIGTQIFPFFDENVLNLWTELEKAVYDSL